jgi:carbon-monoxide dehydrogenase small subunit
MTSNHRISLTVNGQTHNCEVEARLTLADCLRDKLDKTGTHLGCEHGVCVPVQSLSTARQCGRA